MGMVVVVFLLEIFYAFWSQVECGMWYGSESFVYCYLNFLYTHYIWCFVFNSYHAGIIGWV